MVVIRGHQVSDDFWGRQNYSHLEEPITYATPLKRTRKGTSPLAISLSLIYTLQNEHYSGVNDDDKIRRKR